MLRRFVVAVCLVALPACGGSDEAALTPIYPTGTNRDGSTAAVLVSPRSPSIDDSIAANRRIVDCLRAAGFPAELDGDGRDGYNVDVPDGQQASSEQAVQECADKFRLAPGTLSRAEEERFFRASLGQAECLRRHGVDVPPPPSFDEFVDSQHGAWLPDAAALGDTELLAACPTPR